MDENAKNLPRFQNLKFFKQGLLLTQPTKMTRNPKTGHVSVDFTFRWMGSEGRTLLKVLIFIFWNIPFVNEKSRFNPSTIKDLQMRMNNLCLYVMLHHALLQVPKQGERIMTALACTLARFQYELSELAKVVPGVNSGFPKFHWATHACDETAKTGIVR